MRLLLWLLGVSECLLGFEVTRRIAPGWAWAWWLWLVVWMIAGVAVLVAGVISAVKRGQAMLRGGQPAAPRPMPAQGREGD